jgi:nickel-dependent lactate racemase
MARAERALAPGLGVSLPWSVWTSERELLLEIPASWDCVQLRMADAPSLSRGEIARALDQPIGAPALETIARGKRSASIAIDDRTRPLKSAELLPEIADRLTRAGVPVDRITIIVATGAHRRANQEDLDAKIGRELLGRVRAISHDPEADLEDTGVTMGGVPVRINREFASAEVRLGVGGVMPHPFAGFSGGGKIVIPGLADLDVLARTHKLALMGFRGGARLEGNTFRTEMEDAVRRIGLDWTVNVAFNSTRDAAAVCAGDMVEAHRAAATAAAGIGSTAPPDRLLDALVLNAYPKDGELLQVEAALVPLRQGVLSWLAPGAPVVLSAACPEGLGQHALFGPGGRLFRKPSRKSFMTDHPLIIFSPGVSEEEAAAVFWEGYRLCRTWPDVVAALAPRMKEGATIGIMPCAPLQVAVDHGVSGV